MSLEAGLITAALSNLLTPKKSVSQQTNGLPFNVGTNDFQNAQQQSTLGITRQPYRIPINGALEIKTAGKWIKNAGNSIGVIYLFFGAYSGDISIQDCVVLLPGAVYMGAISGVTVLAPNSAAGNLFIGQDGIPPVDSPFTIYDKAADILLPHGDIVTRSARVSTGNTINLFSIPSFAPDGTPVVGYGVKNLRACMFCTLTGTTFLKPWPFVSMFDAVSNDFIRGQAPRVVAMTDMFSSAQAAGTTTPASIAFTARFEFELGDFVLVSPNIRTNSCAIRAEVKDGVGVTIFTDYLYDEVFFK